MRPALGKEAETHSRLVSFTYTDSKSLAHVCGRKLHGPSPNLKGVAAPYNYVDENMKGKALYFAHVFISHYGGFNVLKSPVAAPSSVLTRLLPSSPCVIMLQCLSLSSMLGPSFLSVTNTSDLGSIIFSCM